MCIYYGDTHGLTYKKREHIFPAGLGGKTMLPKGYVSDQANELFSPLELNLMHSSIISLIRAMEGPGKRGSLKPQNASTSEICTYQSDDGTIELGYIKTGKPYTISQIHIDLTKTQFRFICPSDDTQPAEALEEFKKYLLNFSGKFVSIHSKELQPSTIIIGVWKNKFYIAYREFLPDTQYLSDQIKLFCQKAAIKGVSSHETHGEFKLNMIESPDSYRVYAKIAYNVLANFGGKQFVLDSRFDRIRNWILGGNDCKFEHLPQKFSPLPNLVFPPSAHFCFFTCNNGKLIAVVCLYSMWYHTFEFCDWNLLPDEYPYPGILGFVCDWKNGKEYTMRDWILKLVENSDSKEPDKFRKDKTSC